MEQFNSAPAAGTVDQQLLPQAEAAPSSEPPDPKTCSPREYLEFYIFPVLLPGLAELLHEAEKEKCFEGRRTKFIASDFLTEWLYNKNPKRKDESFTEFFSIPFVKDWLKDQVASMFLEMSFLKQTGALIIQGLPLDVPLSPAHQEPQALISAAHPRPPIPLSLLLSEEEASIIIQSFWRGYRVRCNSEIQELRQWQKKFREERHINKIVSQFWTKQEAKESSDFLLANSSALSFRCTTPTAGTENYVQVSEC